MVEQSEYDAIAFSVDCPECCMPPGKRCEGGGSHHPARYDRAIKEGRGIDGMEWLRVKCPDCYREPGEQCASATGNGLNTALNGMKYHPARYAKAGSEHLRPFRERVSAYPGTLRADVMDNKMYLNFECPVCGAKPSQCCLVLVDDKRTWNEPHSARVDRAVRMYANTTYGIGVNEKSEVSHPQHYTSHPSGVECIDVVRHMTFNVGNVIKYLWRAGLKGGEPQAKDLRKALWYLVDEIARVEGGDTGIREVLRLLETKGKDK